MKCCWWNLRVLNKSMHKLSSTGIKTSRVQGCLYRNWVSSPVCDVLWNRKWSCYTWLQPSSTPIPRCFLGSFMKKVQNKTCKWRSSQCTMGKGWTYSWLVHTHIRILEPSSYKDSIFFPDSGSLVTSSMWEFDSLAIYGVECCFSVQPILNWKNSLGKCYKSSFPISFILLQLLFQNCFFQKFSIFIGVTISEHGSCISCIETRYQDVLEVFMWTLLWQLVLLILQGKEQRRLE